MADSQGQDAATARLPLEGRLYAYWEQGMEAVQAALDPTPPNAKATSSAVVPLNEGDVLSVRSREGQEIWRGVLTFLRWPFAKQALPSGWERWFELELPATLLERGRLPCWRRGRERRFLVPANAERRR